MINRHTAAILAGLGAILAAASADAAEVAKPASAFGCRNLETIADLQMMEGKNGMFYRVLNDVSLQHAFTKQTVDHLAMMAKALEKQGTTLVYVPVPTKSQALPGYVPAEAVNYGFDPVIAYEIYEDVVDRLNKAGVNAVNIAAPMRKQPINEAGDFVFYKTDFHWTAHGARLAAQAVGESIRSLPGYQELPHVQFHTVEGGFEKDISTMRRILQAHCTEDVPPVRALTYKTTQVELAKTDSAAKMDLFSDDAGISVVLAGTSFSDKLNSNFAGFIQQETGLTVENYSISGGNQFGSIISYLTSREFKEQKPRYLIWENPIYNNLGQYGAGPWYEILAAAVDDCPLQVSVKLKGDSRLDLDFAGVKVDRDNVLLIDAGQDGPRKITARFTGSDGLVRDRAIERGDRVRATGRFYLSLEGLQPQMLDKATITFDAPITAGSSVSVCKTNFGEQS
jgi:alginate biosynthesis protein AlgX